MDQLIQFLPVIIVIVIIYLLVKFKKPKSVGLVLESFSDTNEQDNTFEEKMLLLQKESNNRLKGIDNTLDWFFWIMIIGGIFYLINIFFDAIQGVI